MTIEERRAEILRKRLLNQRLANAKFSDYQTPMGGPRRRGRGGLLNSTLGALSSVVSNDDNDLDNISFSTTDGMKVNLQNNRAKDSTPKDRLADFSWYRGNYGGGNEDIVEQQTDIHPRIAAMNKHRERLKLEQEDRNRENAMRSDAIGAFIEKNSAAPKSNGSGGFMSNRNLGGNSVLPEDSIMHPDNLNKNQGYSEEELDQIELDYQAEHGSPFKMDSSRIPPVGFASDAGLQLDPEIQAYENIPELDESIREQAIRSGMSQEELDELLLEMEIEKNKELARFKGDSSRIPPAGSVMQPRWEGTGDQNVGYEMPVEDEESVREQAIRNGISQEELDYQLAEEQLAKKLAIGELEAAQEWRDDNPELAEQYDAEILASQKLADEKADEEWVAANPELAALEEELTMESNMATRHPEEDLFAGDNLQLDKDSLIYDDMVTEIADTKDAFMQLNKVDPKITEEVTNIATELEETGDQEKAEFKLSGIFDWLKDIFGVDDKSLLRAFVKYVGGRLFGLSSGKAAAFAWKGIEQDMATEAAKGADARAYADNMAEYESMYDEAMAAGQTERANQILQKMRSESGYEKGSAEEFWDNLAFLNKKYDEASKAVMPDGTIGDKGLMKAIDKQIKMLEEGGIEGSSGDTWYGTMSMTDSKGKEILKQARQTPMGLQYLEDGVWKYPRDYGYSNARRVTTSTEGTDQFATDERTNLLPEEIGRYITEIPGAYDVTAGGLPRFDEGNDTANKNAAFSLTAVNSYMQMEELLNTPEARAEIFSLTESWRNQVKNMSETGPVRDTFNKFIAQDMSPVAKLWFNNMNTLVTSKLRRETGAAYNKEELLTTMNFFPNASDFPQNYSELDSSARRAADTLLQARMSAARDWILKNASGLKSYDYLEGLMSGIYRPDNSFLETLALNRQVVSNHYFPVVSTTTTEIIEGD